MNTLLPGGRPQNVSFVPLTNRLLCTVSANQFVRLKFVENCGRSVQLFVPVDRKTSCAEGGPTSLREMVKANHDYRSDW